MDNRDLDMWPRFGIKIGNSTLCIAYIKEDGKSEVIANKQGDRVSQACLLWDGVDEIECGLTAKQKMATRPTQGVTNSFQLFMPEKNLTDKAITSALKNITCEYDSSHHTFHLRSTNQTSTEATKKSYEINAFEIQVQLLQAERDLAKQYHNGKNCKPIVVLSIPSYYPKETWTQLAKAAEQAGFHVGQIISESTAGLLAYNIGQTKPSSISKHVLTIKSGGLYSHFALYSELNGLYNQIAVFGPYAIGGNQYTEALVKFICEEFQRKYKLDPNESRRSMAKIRSAASTCKHILTSLPSTQLYIDSLMDGIDYSIQMSRARFESLIQPVIANFMQTLNETLNEETLKQNTDIKEIDEIVLLGATMQIPKLQAAIVSRFPNAILHATLSTDEVAAYGCAKQASFLIEPEKTDLQATEDCIFSEEELKIWHGDNEQNAKILINKGTMLPYRVIVDVELCKNVKDNSVFRLSNNDQVNEILLDTTKSKDEKIVNIEADIDLEVEDKIKKPMIRLRCF